MTRHGDGWIAVGCDIHPAIERRIKGVWKYYQPKDECPWYWEYTYDRVTHTRSFVLDAAGNRVPSKWDKCKTRLPGIFNDRNYGTFSVLANVRNDDTNPWPYIQDYRGLPWDLTPGARRWTGDEDDGDLHSQGWVTLRELQDFSFTQLVATYEDGLVPIACEVPIIEMIEYMTKLIPKGGTPDDVRLVFSFDN